MGVWFVEDDYDPEPEPRFVTELGAGPACEICSGFAQSISRQNTEDDRDSFAVEADDASLNFPSLAASPCGVGICRFVRACLIAQFGVRPLVDITSKSPNTNPESNVYVEIETHGFDESDDGSQFSGMLEVSVRLRRSDVPAIPKVVQIAFAFNSELPPTARDTLGHENLELIRAWCRDCDKTHDACKLNRKGFCPKRLVDLGPDDGQLSLVDGGDIEGDFPCYHTLSYCWGKQQAGTQLYHTTKENLATRKVGFLQDELPRSLQDAIVVARTLGAPYIWIDALCIVQDDLADWADQAAQMWQIFENSDLTIAAVSARNVFEGFLERPWHQSVKVACERRAADGEGEEEDGQVSRGELALQFPHNSSNSDSLVNSRWNERAWIFQEQILCSRILYFLDELLAMDCLSSQLRTEVPLDHKPRTQRNPWTPKILPKTGTSHVRTRGDDYLDWYALMTFYSGKQLSFPEDKLPAVSGLAHKMLQTHNDTYLAGLWKGDLCRGLMWWPMNNIRAAEYSTYVAPSWSWAAHNGGVTWASQGPTGFRQEMELLDVVVSPAGADPHGRLQSGYLDVVAKTLPWRNMFDGPLVYTAYLAEEGGRKSGPRAQVRHDSIKFGWSTADDVLALRVGTAQLGEGPQTASGLLVQAVPPTDQFAHGASKWRRVGWFKCDNSKFTSAIGKTFVLV